MHSSQAWQIASVLCAALSIPTLVSAQALATVNGRLIDPSGGVLPGVTITASAAATGVSRTTVTNAEGLYSIPALEPGLYEVKAELAGFTTTITRDVRLTVGSVVTVDLTMSIGTLEEKTVVTGQAPLIEVTKSELKVIVSKEEIQDLPLLARNFTSLVLLVPGARTGNRKFPSQFTQGSMSFGGTAGGGGGSAGLTVDGGENTNHGVHDIALNWTLEAIEEFKVATNQFSASQGGTAGASIAILTKSGTNEVHGSAFLFGKNEPLTARDYFTEQAGREKAPYDRQQFGGSVGGPIRRNKAFFFGAVEHIRENESRQTPQGAFNELQLLVPFGANPVQVRPLTTRNTMYFGKISFQLPAHSIFARVGGQEIRAQNNQGLGTIRDLLPTGDPTDVVSALVSDAWVISSRILNQVMFQALIWDNKVTLSRLPPAIENLVFPSVSIGQGGLARVAHHQHTFQVRDELTVLAGAHSFNGGGSFFVDTVGPGGLGHSNEQGSFTFFDDPSVILSNTAKYPQGFQTPGALRQYGQALPNWNEPLANIWQFSGWFQDDWRVTDNLSLNLGVRYEVFHWLVSDLEIGRPYKLLQAIGDPLGRSLPQTDKNNVAPRVGFAYRLNGDKTVFRGGWGLYFDQHGQQFHAPQFSLSKPSISASRTLINTTAGVGELANYRFGIDPPPPLLRPEEGADFPFGSRSNANWFSPDYSDQYSHQAHVGISHSLTPTIAVNVDFATTVQRNLAIAQQINPIINGVRRLAPALATAYGDPNRVGSFLVNVNGVEGRYDEFVVRLQGSGSWANWQGSYTLSNGRGCGGYLIGDRFGGLIAEQWDVLCGPGDYAPYGTDERHRVVMSGSFLVPGGVRIAPILQAASARPYTLLSGVDSNRDGTFNDRYVDPTTGVKVAANSEHGDPFFLLDLRVSKAFSFSASKRIEPFAEFFNLTNTVNFGQNYNGNALSAFFKQPQALMVDVGYPRQVQFGARVSF